MKVTSAPLATHLGANATTIATCWRVTRTDAEVFGFTSHDRDLEIDGLTYAAANAVNRSAVETHADLSVSNMEVKGVLDSEAFTEDDFRAGVWDHAEVRIFEVNYQDLTMGTLRQLRGWLGEVTFEGQGYKAELRGLASALNKTIGEIVGPGCTAALGDERCKEVLTDYTTTGEVTAVTDNRVFDTNLSAATVRLTPATTGAPPADYFAAGLITWLTGANAGRRMEVRTNDAIGEVALQLPMVSTVAPGDTFSIVSGCAKSREVCIEKFGNIVNFRGFPDLPGMDKVLRVGGQ